MITWYNTPKAKKIQPDDGLKRAETCSCVTNCTIQCNKVCCVWTASYTYVIYIVCSKLFPWRTCPELLR